jgi:hypothetical protein
MLSKLSKQYLRFVPCKLFYSMSQPKAKKTLIFIRHGQTENNAFFEKHRWGEPGFEDPLMWDTVLNETGMCQTATIIKILRDELLKRKFYFFYM